MFLRPIGGSAPGLIAVACSPRRVRSQMARLGTVALPAGLSEKALMLMEALSSARAEGGRELGEELICFINPHGPPAPLP